MRGLVTATRRVYRARSRPWFHFAAAGLGCASSRKSCPAGPLHSDANSGAEPTNAAYWMADELMRSLPSPACHFINGGHSQLDAKCLLRIIR